MFGLGLPSGDTDKLLRVLIAMTPLCPSLSAGTLKLPATVPGFNLPFHVDLSFLSDEKLCPITGKVSPPVVDPIERSRNLGKSKTDQLGRGVG